MYISIFSEAIIMLVRDVMKTKFKTISPQTTYEEAARLMSGGRVSGLFVVDQDKIVGVVSEKDLFKLIYPRYGEFAQQPEEWLDQEHQEAEIESTKNRPVSEFMTKAVLTIESKSAVMRAGGIMLSHGIHMLPVVDQGKFIGIVTREEIYGALLAHHLGFGGTSGAKNAANG